MTISALSGSAYTLLRVTPFLLDPVTAASGGHAPSRQPTVPCSVQVKSLAAGQVAVTGMVSGSPVTESLVFAAAGFRATARLFSSVTTLTPSGALLGTTIEAKALGADGSPQVKLASSIATGVVAAFSPGTPKWARRREGQAEDRGAMIALDYRSDLEPRRQDFLLDEVTGERWQVQGVNLFRGGVIPHHWEIHVELWDGEALG